VTTAPLLVPALVLAAVLTVSGLAKAADPDGTADAITALRLPPALLALRVPRLLPWAEVALAAVLLLAPGPGYAAAAALTLALMVVYVVVVGRALRFPDPVSCACFGRLGTGTVSRVALARNLVLTGLAALALGDALTHRAVLPRLRDLGGDGWLWLSMVAAGALVTGLIAAPGAATPAPPSDEDYLRAPIPHATLVTLDGTPVTLRELARTRARLLVLVTLSCGSCLRVIDRLPGFAARTPELGTHVVIGTAEEAAQLPPGLDPLLDPGAGLRELFEVRTPAAVLLGADGRLAGGPVVGFDAVTELMAAIVARLDAERTGP